ncbi:MAG: hypothetical protein Ct9H300mP16_01010 [Pseudomonadota bacterium]|nr:MAG: hypothetical protein Ct9H300mP16_01010 [Pseudomonadota bacterium]
MPRVMTDQRNQSLARIIEQPPGFDSFSDGIFKSRPGVVEVGAGAQTDLQPLLGQFQLPADRALVWVGEPQVVLGGKYREIIFSQPAGSMIQRQSRSQSGRPPPAAGPALPSADWSGCTGPDSRIQMQTRLHWKDLQSSACSGWQQSSEAAVPLWPEVWPPETRRG